MDGYGMHTCCQLPVAGCRLSTNVESIWNPNPLPTERKSAICSHCLLSPSTESELVASKAIRGLGPCIGVRIRLGRACYAESHSMQECVYSTIARNGTRPPKAKAARPINGNRHLQSRHLPAHHPPIRHSAPIPDHDCSDLSTLGEPGTTFDHIIPRTDGTSLRP